ncbi:general stress protein [Streptomyces sp. 900105755]|uniref:general stress protein n=1 Tax=Streptomyces sp. NPDC001507 TaxID=3364579 RepID=UPI0036AE052C
MTEQARRAIATSSTYQEAEPAVDHLADQGFPLQKVAITGQDLRLVQQVLGRMGYGEAALHGAATGALPGVLVGWLFGLLNWLNPVVSGLLLALYGLIFGAVVGALLGVLLHAARGGRRNFASVRSIEPSRHDVVADEDAVDDAVQLVAGPDSGAGANPESPSSRGRRPRSGSVKRVAPAPGEGAMAIHFVHRHLGHSAVPGTTGASAVTGHSDVSPRIRHKESAWLA